MIPWPSASPVHASICQRECVHPTTDSSDVIAARRASRGSQYGTMGMVSGGEWNSGGEVHEVTSTGACGTNREVCETRVVITTAPRRLSAPASSRGELDARSSELRRSMPAPSHAAP